MDRAPVYETGGWRFESSRMRHFGYIMNSLKFIFAFLFVLSLQACTSLNRKGCYIDDSAIDSIMSGITYKDNVIEKLGEPSYKIDDNTFLYHSYFENTYGIASTKSYNEQILLLYFNDDGYLKKKVFKEEKISKFKYNKYKDNIIENNDNFFKDIIKNVDMKMLQ